MLKIIMKFLFYSIGNWLPISYYPFGFLGKKFRYFCAKFFITSIGKNVNIEKGAFISPGLSVGDNSGIGVNCVISDQVFIGSNVMMGPDCLFYTRNHKFAKVQKKYLGYTEIKPIIVGDDVWLGARCIILPGVKIGRGSTIGAGSIVTKDVPPYSVSAGNPAKVLKSLL